MISVLLVEDHATLRQALRAVMAMEDDLRVVAETSYGADAAAAAVEHQPTVAIIDLDLPDGSGVQAIEQVRAASPGTGCLVLTALTDDVELGRAIHAGASAVLHKSVDMSHLLEVLRTVANGDTVLPVEDTSRRLQALERMRRERWHADLLRDSLTGREFQVLELLISGADGRRIARELNISPRTADTHIRNLLAKLNVRSRLEAVAKALRLGLVDPPSLP